MFWSPVFKPLQAGVKGEMLHDKHSPVTQQHELTGADA